MTLAKRIVPCLDVKQGRVVKGEHFVNLKDAGDPVELGIKYRDDGADELVFLDITASPEKRKIVSEMVRNVAAKLDIPFTVGGGISSINDARDILCSGADKIGINTMAIEKPELITEISERFGKQCCVVAIDAKQVKKNKTIQESNQSVNQYQEKQNNGMGIFSFLIVLVISVAAIILALDTFKNQLIPFFPDLDNYLVYIFETLNNIYIIIIDLFNNYK